MSDKYDPNKGELTISRKYNLATKRSDLVKRGLDLTDEVNRQKVIEAAHLIFNKACACYYKDDFNQAVSYFSKAIEKANEINVPYADAYYFRGLSFEKKGYIDLASADYAEALATKKSAYLSIYFHAFKIDPRIDPRYANINYSSLNGLPWWEQAISDYIKPIEITLRESLFYCKNGHTCYEVLEYNRAITEYTNALVIDPHNALAFYKRGNLGKRNRCQVYTLDI
jgi:tetratricopeptide (TPR) repeat protein